MQPSDASILSLEIPELEISTVADITGIFRPLLEQGFLVRISGSETVQNALCQQLGVAEKYLRDRVQTVFLNGKAVDDETTAVVHDGDRLALSASMPGLVGATMRKGGFFSGLRANISHRKSSDTKSGEPEAVITIKLFNMIASEIGPIFLENGIILKANHLQGFLDEKDDELRQRISSAAIDSQPLDLKQIKAHIGETPFVGLRVVPVE